MKNTMLMRRLMALCLFMTFIALTSCEDDDTTADDPVIEQTMMEIIEDETGDSDDLDSLAKYLDHYPDLMSKLSADGDATFFAPTNQAFINLLEVTGFSASITDIDPEIVEAVLSYHLVPGQRVTSADMEEGLTLNTDYTDPESSEVQVITVNDDGTLLTGAANSHIALEEEDIEATNGVVHKVEAVLIPPSIGDMLRPILGTLAGTVMLSDQFTYLADMIELADSQVPEGQDSISAMLSGTGTFTTFAPPNAVFENLAGSEDPEVVADFINSYDPATARAILLTHIVADGAMATADFTDGATLTAASGAMLTITVEDTPTDSPTGYLVSSPGNTSVPILDIDIVHTNGIAHVIGGLLLPE